jgi:hypothetical protein
MPVPALPPVAETFCGKPIWSKVMGLTARLVVAVQSRALS